MHLEQFQINKQHEMHIEHIAEELDPIYRLLPLQNVEFGKTDKDKESDKNEDESNCMRPADCELLNEESNECCDERNSKEEHQKTIHWIDQKFNFFSLSSCNNNSLKRGPPIAAAIAIFGNPCFTTAMSATMSPIQLLHAIIVSPNNSIDNPVTTPIIVTTLTISFEVACDLLTATRKDLVKMIIAKTIVVTKMLVPNKSPSARSAFGFGVVRTEEIELKTSGAPFPKAKKVTPAMDSLIFR
ncbi:hypothetical protein GCK72_018452 [Caenorhabditis remanei]|uniref:Uncharacterized protein n=1 Tax=Caenorhabditis remanei TaxID=31234 RepID=A0A6A5G9U0_CAERE|nr:hypothetical protein GCK72_018452 [Caenorhabditis remanei]KAF1751898.1 hypothetical protein GCK72_018452 [Caenorhabditis remanei]